MKYAISFFLCLSLSGCVGPQFLKVQRYKYNEAIQESTAEQLLLNIVRLRYNDSPMFLNVGDIDARFSLEASSMASGTINENVGADPLNANSATVTASSGFTNNPNIKLSPMQDADFARLLEPLTSDEMLALAKRRGSPYEYLALAMQSYTYTPEPKKEGDTDEPEDGEGDTDEPEDGEGDADESKDGEEEITVDAYRDPSVWKTFLKQLRDDDDKGALRIKNKEEEETFLPSYAASSIAPEDVIKAKLAGLTFKAFKDPDNQCKKHGEEEYVLVRSKREWTMMVHVVPPDTRKELKTTKREYRFLPKQDSKPDSSGEDEEQVHIKFRSIVQMMYCLSLGVKVPASQEREGIKQTEQSPYLDFVVDVARHAPPSSEAFVSVKYRGHWFYIKRRYKAEDPPEVKASIKASKKFFSVLTELFVERAGKPATTATTLAL